MSRSFIRHSKHITACRYTNREVPSISTHTSPYIHRHLHTPPTTPQVDDIQPITTPPHATSLHAQHQPSPHELQKLKHFVDQCQSLLIVTGAGISTDSGIADYRSPGRPKHQPMQHHDFMSHHTSRQRYWARSMVGYLTVWQSKPNVGHYATAYAQHTGRCHHIVTQNVDGLHTAAGAHRVTELHGSIHVVRCQSCDHTYQRSEFQQWLAELNPDMYDRLQSLTSQVNQKNSTADSSSSTTIDRELAEKALRPDGDFNLSQRPDGDMEGLSQSIYQSFNYPSCANCHTGILKPDVVFFGHTVPKHVHAECDAALEKADGVLVVGSSLTVWSAYRLIRAAAAHNHKLRPRISLSHDEQHRYNHMHIVDVGILNDGPTRADPICELKVQARAGSVLPWLFDMPHDAVHALMDHAQSQNAHIHSEAPL